MHKNTFDADYLFIYSMDLSTVRELCEMRFLNIPLQI